VTHAPETLGRRRVLVADTLTRGHRGEGFRRKEKTLGSIITDLSIFDSIGLAFLFGCCEAGTLV